MPGRQIFYTIDHKTLLPISRKERVDVHKDGDWHFAVTAFIFRNTPDGSIEVLVQERSEYVDIAQKHFDQSLATQLLVEDENDTKKALYRGLREELDLHVDDIDRLHLWNNLGSIYISKQYKSNPELWNREVVANYLVYIKYSSKLNKNFKVLGLEWLPWEEVCNLVRIRPNKFTKSVRIYCVSDLVSADIYEKMKSMVSNESAIVSFNGKILYESLPDLDVIAIRSENNSDWDVAVYSTDYSMSIQKRMKLKQVNALESIMFAEENGVSSETLLEHLKLS